MEVENQQEIECLEGLDVARGGTLLLRRERLRGRQVGEQVVSGTNGVELVGPVIAAEGGAARIERAVKQLAGESGIGAVEAEHLTAQDSSVDRDIRKLLAERDHHPVGRR